jgi:D-tyrosyl-tRNA(Tyr) deacylase
MRAVVQRVSQANVTVDGEVVGRTKAGRPGLLILLGVGKGDEIADVDYLVRKICGLRIFEDEQGRMNRSVQEVDGSLLVVSQFTLFGDCRKGRRPSFVAAKAPEEAEALVEHFVRASRGELSHVETGKFRTHMRVESINDGPVTLLLDSKKVF